MTVAVDVVLSAFHAVEERDEQALARLYHPQIEFCWPASLPFGRSPREHEMLAAGGRTWAQAWDPFQGADERKMDPRVVAASENEVVVLWQQRGRSRRRTALRHARARALPRPRWQTRASADVLLRHSPRT